MDDQQKDEARSQSKQERPSRPGKTTRTMKRVIARLNSHVPFFRRRSSSGPDEERNQIRRCDVDLASGEGGMLGRADSPATPWVVLSEL